MPKASVPQIARSARSARVAAPAVAKPPAEWLVVLLPDGHVESVAGGAPVGWRGRSLRDPHHEDVPPAVRLAATALLAAPANGALVQRRRLAVEVGEQTVEVEIVLLEGLPLRRSYVPIGQLLLRTLDAFVHQAHGNDVDLHVEQSPEVPSAMYLDGEKIAWVVATLVGNALRYARPDKAHPAHVRVKLDFQTDTQLLVLRVKDNGPGMPAGRTRWLFERDPATGAAAGLALLMVRDVVVAHRGSIEVESALGKGTTFTLRLPRAAPLEG